MTLTATRQTMNARDWALLIVLSMMWGASFIFMEIGIRDFPTLTIVAIRVSLAALILNGFVLARGQRLSYSASIWKSFALMAVMGNVIPFSLFVWGQIYITAGLSSILNATVPFFTVIGIYFFTKDEALTPQRIIGLLAGFSGVVAIIGPGALIQERTHILAELAPLTAAACYAVAILYAKRFKDLGVPALHMAAGQLTMAAVILVPIALVIERPWMTATPSLESMAALTGLGVMSTGIAIAVYYYLLNAIGAVNVSLVTFLIPVSANIFAFLLFGDVIEHGEIIGMVLIFSGLFVMNYRHKSLK